MLGTNSLRNNLQKLTFIALHRSRISTQFVPLVDLLRDPKRQQKVAVIDTPISASKNNHRYVTYAQLDHYTSLLADSLRRLPDRPVGAFTKPHLDYVISLLAAWKAKKCFVPLSNSHSIGEISYFIVDSKLSTIICPSKENIPADVLSLPVSILETHPLFLPLTNSAPSRGKNTSISAKSLDSEAAALIVYTSGTTGRPKGVAHTESSLHHMISSLTDAWEYSPSDRILHFLPLYHMHGLMNKLLTVLYNGGTVQFLSSASSEVIWKALAQEQEQLQPILSQKPPNAETISPLSLFMAVPTVYAKLLEHLSSLSSVEKEKALKTISALRLQVSGSAALPDSVLSRWRELTGCTLLERYGMTETGMALSNPLRGERRAGSVGLPMKYVELRVRATDPPDDNEGEAQQGELLVRGPCVFKEYLNNPSATTESFVVDAEGRWFRTGDIVKVSTDGYYNILGRASTDIIKTSGYKVSALEIERELLSHSSIEEVAVVGKGDKIRGEAIVAVLRSNNDKITTEELDKFLGDKLAPYKRPKEYILVDQLPRNALGKVNKKTLLRDIGKE